MPEEIKPQEQKGTQDNEIQEGKVLAILAYLGILCLVPLLIKKENKFVFFHAKQGLVLFIAEVALGIMAMVPFLGWVISFIGFIIVPIICLIAIIKVLSGEYWRIPVVADIADKINL